MLFVLLASVGAGIVAAQAGGADYDKCDPAKVKCGSFALGGRPKIDGNQERLKRKRFYLFVGGLAANKPLIDRLKAANPVSRDCFYCQMNASPEYVAWLKAEDCESPYCRAITPEDVQKVPEFKAAYQKGLAPRQFRGKTAIAQTWLTTNLAPELRDGFYRQRKMQIQSLLAGSGAIQTAMTDSVKSSDALFVDIPLKLDTVDKKTETFLYSNLVPIEIGKKSYVWACEIEVGSAKKAVATLKVPENDKAVPKCEVIVKDLTPCSSGTCVKPVAATKTLVPSVEAAMSPEVRRKANRSRTVARK